MVVLFASVLSVLSQIHAISLSFPFLISASSPFIMHIHNLECWRYSSLPFFFLTHIFSLCIFLEVKPCASSSTFIFFTPFAPLFSCTCYISLSKSETIWHFYTFRYLYFSTFPCEDSIFFLRQNPFSYHNIFFIIYISFFFFFIFANRLISSMYIRWLVIKWLIFPSFSFSFSSSCSSSYYLLLESLSHRF